MMSNEAKTKKTAGKKLVLPTLIAPWKTEKLDEFITVLIDRKCLSW
jgi:hypothetical protein